MDMNMNMKNDVVNAYHSNGFAEVRKIKALLVRAAKQGMTSLVINNDVYHISDRAMNYIKDEGFKVSEHNEMLIIHWHHLV